MVGVYCVGSGTEKAAAYAVAGPNNAKVRSVNAIVFP